jgi:hypothetical protein
MGFIEYYPHRRQGAPRRWEANDHPDMEDCRNTYQTFWEEACALADDDDETYIHTTANNSGYIWFHLNTDDNPPAGARVRHFWARRRSRRTVSATRSLRFNLGETVANSTAIGRNSRAFSPPQSFAWELGYRYGGEVLGPRAEALARPYALTFHYLDQRVVIGVEQVGKNHNGQIQVAELRMLVEYDERPEVEYLGPLGSMLETNTPTVSWEYSDDYEAQTRHHVQH